MATNPKANGYGTLEQLRGVKRLEKDYRDWPVMPLRLQALTSNEIEQITAFAKDPVTGEARAWADRDAQVAFGLVQPDIASIAATDLAAAVEEIQVIPIGVRMYLSQTILYELTYCNPKDAYQAFQNGDGSRAPEEGTPSGSSTSQNDSATGTPAS